MNNKNNDPVLKFYKDNYIEAIRLLLRVNKMFLIREESDEKFDDLFFDIRKFLDL
jgi:hypothetical protein